MTIKIRVDVPSKQHAKAIEAGLERPDVRAFVLAVGLFDALPSDRARERVLRYLNDYVSDPSNLKLGEPQQSLRIHDAESPREGV